MEYQYLLYPYLEWDIAQSETIAECCLSFTVTLDISIYFDLLLVLLVMLIGRYIENTALDNILNIPFCWNKIAVYWIQVKILLNKTFKNFFFLLAKYFNKLIRYLRSYLVYLIYCVDTKQQFDL